MSNVYLTTEQPYGGWRLPGERSDKPIIAPRQRQLLIAMKTMNMNILYLHLILAYRGNPTAVYAFAFGRERPTKDMAAMMFMLFGPLIDDDIFGEDLHRYKLAEAMDTMSYFLKRQQKFYAGYQNSGWSCQQLSPYQVSRETVTA